MHQITLEPLSLSVNFRSDQGIVDLVNQAFGAILPPGDDGITGEVSHRVALAHRSHQGGDLLSGWCGHPARALTTNLASDGNEQGGAGILPAWARNPAGLSLSCGEVDMVVREVRAVLESRKPDHQAEGGYRAPVAVLVRARPHAVQILAALREAGLGVTPIEIDSLALRPHVRDLVMLTAALAHPGDRLAWTALLHGPAFGLPYADLLRLGGNRNAAHPPELPRPDDDESPTDPAHIRLGKAASSVAQIPIWQLLEDPVQRARLSPHACSRVERALPILQRALGQWGRRPTHLLVEGVWMALGLPGLYPGEPLDTVVSDAEQVWNCIQNLESEGESVTRPNLEARLMQATSPTPLESPDRVTVCTIHKAKGLEWDTVILPGLDRQSRRDQPPLITYDTLTLEDGVFPLICPMAEKDSRGYHSLGRFLAGLRQRRLQAELNRLLYVAMTRARRRLVLTANAPRAAEGSFLQRLRLVQGLFPNNAPSPRGQDARTTPTADPLPDPPPGPSAQGPSFLLPSYQIPPPGLPDGAGRTKEDFAQYEKQCKEWLQARRQRLKDVRDQARLTIRHPATDWTLPAMPDLPKIPRLLRRPDRSVQTQLQDIRRHVLSGRVLIPGQAFHRILLTLARRPGNHPLPEADQTARGGALDELLRRSLALEGIPPEQDEGQGDSYHDRLRRVLCTALADPALRWTLSLPGEAEVSVEGIHQGEYTLGRIDRTFEDPATRIRYIVDYKVVSHEGGGLEAYLHQRALSYAPQLERYGRLLPALIAPNAPRPAALRLALFFAAQGRWAVWEPGREPTLLAPGTAQF
jgi:ATP-dependent exoDNAse (exonuclease V) beta subunit